MKICLEEGKETSFPDNSYHKRSDGDVGRGKIAFKKIFQIHIKLFLMDHYYFRIQ